MLNFLTFKKCNKFIKIFQNELQKLALFTCRIRVKFSPEKCLNFLPSKLSFSKKVFGLKESFWVSFKSQHVIKTFCKSQKEVYVTPLYWCADKVNINGIFQKEREKKSIPQSYWSFIPPSRPSGIHRKQKTHFLISHLFKYWSKKFQILCNQKKRNFPEQKYTYKYIFATFT